MKFRTLTDKEMQEIDGGVIGWFLLGEACLLGGFGIGYGLARWLG